MPVACLVGDDIRYYVRWIHGDESVIVASYNPDTSVFTLTDFAEGRVEFHEEVVGEVTWRAIIMQGQYSLIANTLGELRMLQVREFGSVSGQPVLEFVREFNGTPSVILRNSKAGQVGVRRAIEGSIPENSDRIRVFSKISFELDGTLYADRVREVGLLGNENGDFIVTDQGMLIEL